MDFLRRVGHYESASRFVPAFELRRYQGRATVNSSGAAAEIGSTNWGTGLWWASAESLFIAPSWCAYLFRGSLTILQTHLEHEPTASGADENQTIVRPVQWLITIKLKKRFTGVTVRQFHLYIYL